MKRVIYHESAQKQEKMVLEEVVAVAVEIVHASSAVKKVTFLENVHKLAQVAEVKMQEMTMKSKLSSSED